MTRVCFKRLMCLLLAVIITALMLPPTSVVAVAQEKAPQAETAQETQKKTKQELSKDVMAGLLTVEEAFGTLDANTVPEIVGYDSAVARTHIARMYEEEGDNLNQVIFLNADGSRTAYFYDHPVKYIDSAGEIKDISLDIAEADVAGQFKTAANSSVTTFSKNVTDGISLRSGDSNISLVPHLPSAATKTLTTEKAVANATARKINNKTVAYTYDDKTTLEYSLTYTGFKEDIVVSEYTGQTRYDFTLYTGGLKLTERNGSFYLTDASDAVKAQLGDIIIFTADDRNNTMGDMVAKTVVENQEYLLTILIDPEFLADEKTAYPIRIDPTVEFTHEDNGPGAIEDVTINSNGGSDGTAYSLSIGWREDLGVARILMKFPILDFEGWGINTIITGAQVELRDLMCGEEELEMYCHIFSGNEWTETTANWSNVSPNSISTHMSSHMISYENGLQQPKDHTYAFDITAAVNGWRTGACNQNKGIIFTSSHEGVEDGAEYLHKILASYNRSEHQPTISVTYEENASLLWDDTYYLNNLYHGDYLRYSASIPTGAAATSGLISTLGDSIRWEIRGVYGGVVIRSKADPTKYLAVPENTSYSGVTIVTLNNAAIPMRCVWRPTVSASGGCLLRNQHNSQYLYSDENGTLYTSPHSGSVGFAVHKTRVWRILSTHDYGNASHNEYRELESGFSVSPLLVNLGEYAEPTINAVPANTVWAKPSDFVFECYWDSEPIASFLYNTGEGFGEHYGISNYMAIHKVTNQTVVFVVYVERYMYELVNLYGFDADEAMLIRSVYDAVDSVYEDEPEKYRAWVASRLLSEFVYDGHTTYFNIISVNKWDDVAGSVTTSDNRKTYFINTLQFTEEDYNVINDAIKSQHSSAQSGQICDFAHMQFSIAARLAYILHLDGELSNIYTGSDNETISYLGGWLGDATIITNGTTIMGNDDYMSDLDAENIFRRINGGMSAIEAINEYYGELTVSRTRADIFLEQIPYSEVESQVFYELIDRPFYVAMGSAMQNGDYYLWSYYSELIADEQYHWDIIYSDYPDTYNFLISLSAGLSEIYDYRGAT